MLEQFYGEISRRKVMAYAFISLDHVFDYSDAFFYVRTEIDMYVAHRFISVFIH